MDLILNLDDYHIQMTILNWATTNQKVVIILFDEYLIHFIILWMVFRSNYWTFRKLHFKNVQFLMLFFA